MEGPWCDHAMQILLMGVDQIDLYFTTVAFFYKFCRVSLHGRPVVAHLLQAYVKLFLSLVLPTLS